MPNDYLKWSNLEALSTNAIVWALQVGDFIPLSFSVTSQGYPQIMIFTSPDGLFTLCLSHLCFSYLSESFLTLCFLYFWSSYFHSYALWLLLTLFHLKYQSSVLPYFTKHFDHDIFSILTHTKLLNWKI